MTPRTILFDFDGVLVRKDSFGSWLRDRLRRERWRILPLLPIVPFMPLFFATVRGTGWMARVAVRLATAGLTEAEFLADIRTFGRRFVARPGMRVDGAVARVREHVAAGDRVLVVSACAQPLLDTILAELGLADVEAIGSDVAIGRFGVRAAFHNYGANKLVALAKRGVAAPWDVAYSDSRADLPMLRHAQQAVLVNPSARDERAVRAVLGGVAVERL
ncbi:haloacid dehalogenase-like hydrolase [Tahibacter soli]|uniref:Haloacid dehalogenase-like hydrolase n=1 Tax=Tahibacter soli TaxID=2983605 RepID=A0A9X3YHK0_9GAMM|nr:haloacid dehalogenase-like hydrolase [Tahibacter soli]MDC8010943.1 haloacid dehalogenase-like hydrolase [Tahibacter soli]